MKSCFQFESQSVLCHGYSVLAYFEDLHNHLAKGMPLKRQWRMPDWIGDVDVSKLLPMGTIRQYLIYHDCGKPLCRTVDEEGKQHFPDHAEVSYRRWLEYSDDMAVANLIRMDMDAHTMKSEEVEEFSRRPQATTLLLAALAELHSNAQMFGGIDSTSFKIKWKRLNKIGKRVLTSSAVSVV